MFIYQNIHLSEQILCPRAVRINEVVPMIFIWLFKCYATLSDVQRLLRLLMSNKRLYLNKRLFVHKRTEHKSDGEIRNKTIEAPEKKGNIRIPFKRYRMYHNIIKSINKDLMDRGTKSKINGIQHLEKILQKLMHSNRNTSFREPKAWKDKSKMFPIARIG